MLNGFKTITMQMHVAAKKSLRVSWLLADFFLANKFYFFVTVPVKKTGVNHN